jgi:hypothetical protein
VECKHTRIATEKPMEEVEVFGTTVAICLDCGMRAYVQKIPNGEYRPNESSGTVCTSAFAEEKNEAGET